MISIDSIVKQYSPSVRIGSISLDIPAGGITALVGPNGAGKSTLLTMIGRLLGIDEGTIEVGGLNVATTKVLRVGAAPCRSCARRTTLSRA